MKFLSAFLLSLFLQLIPNGFGAPLDDISCPSGWLGNNSLCYFTRISDYLTDYHSARNFCLFLESDLVIIGKAAIQTEIENLLPKPERNFKGVWIGLNDLQSPGEFLWEDGSPMTFVDFPEAGAENNSNATGNCVALNLETHKWQFENCSTEMGFICAKNGAFNQITDSSTSSQCDDKMVQFLDSCYWTVHDSQDWTVSERRCQIENGHLATVSNSLENMFIYEAVRSEPAAYWLGMYRDDTGFAWVSRENSSFTNWDGLPGNHSSLCVVMEYNGKWLTQPCDFLQISRAICKRPIEKNNLTNEENNTCPSTWINEENECYLVGQDPTTWQDARNRCLSVGADLLALKSEQDQSRFLNLLKKFNNSSDLFFWLNVNVSNNNEDLSEETSTEQDSCPRFLLATNKSTSAPCSEKSFYVCEQKTNRRNIIDCEGCETETVIASTITTLPTTTEETVLIPETSSSFTVTQEVTSQNFGEPCPPKWILLDDKCYLIAGILEDVRVNWSTAAKSCRQFGVQYDLVSIHSKMHSEFLQNEMKRRNLERAWIGLNDNNIEGNFVWSDGSDVDFKDWGWQDNQTFNQNVSSENRFFTKTDNMKDCVKIETYAMTGNWIATECDVLLGYICQKSIFLIPFATKPSIDIITSNTEASEEPTLVEKSETPTDQSDILGLNDITQLTGRNDFPFSTEVPNIVSGWNPDNEIPSDAPPVTVDDTSPSSQVVTAKCQCNDSEQMTSGTMAGIILSCILGSVLIVTAIFYWQRRRIMSNYGSSKFSFDNALYNPHADHIQLDAPLPPRN